MQNDKHSKHFNSTHKYRRQRMRNWLLYTVLLGVGSVASVFALNPAAVTTPLSNAAQTNYLDQGWDHQTRQQLSFTSFGSRLIPYDWFIALEQAQTTQLFRDPAHMSALGFIITEPDEYNPDGLPVGVVRDKDKKHGDYVGLTCAACHTGQVSINGQRIRIDGGQALIDFTGFEIALVAALEATLADAEKFSRFYVRLSQLQSNNFSSVSLATQSLQVLMQARLQELQQRLHNNKTDVPYGHGRLDAFGQIFNAIAVEALNMPANIHSPNAPTSYPVMWDASHLDLVQWNGSAPNKEPGPLFQNAITALAVYGTIDIKKEDLSYRSSIRINHLADLQNAFYQLTAPQWPQQFAGALDEKKVATGKTLYQQHCADCHTYVNPADKKRKLRVVLTPVAEVGTDPLMAHNFSQRKVQTGILEGERSLLLVGKKFTAEASSLDLVTHAALGALLNQPWQSFKAIVREYKTNFPATPSTIDSYKARPINGIWASAPYLHNGSVPSIYDLLLPAKQRPQTFYVGNIELDLQKVGHLTSAAPNTSLFDTRLPGNSNSGHEYGTELNDEQRWALVEYIKSL
uniref:di-heme-cytochrome C peroxidase n=1 Tax=Cellvibrio fontiphilus TaxID=1815559 RepID=UPI002B4BF358|nr:di-heme-cytochrome C peroxidase [Cellvibrio fontiphilus]